MALANSKCNVDGIGYIQPVHRLQHQRQTQSLLQLDDHQTLVVAYGDDITGPDLSLDDVALSLEKLLDGAVEVGLQACMCSATEFLRA